jgi:hypothetical protein
VRVAAPACVLDVLEDHAPDRQLALWHPR